MNEFIDESTITLFSKSNCKRCDMMKIFIKNNNHNFVEVKIDELDDDVAFCVLDELKNIPYVEKMFPFCFYYGKYISMNNLQKKLTLTFNDIDIIS